MRPQYRIRQIRILALLLALALLLPSGAFAQETAAKTVRVGWYESTYCYRDRFGRRRGMAYEYQQKIAAHTGWKYEYVEDSWPNLMQMLMDGELDLLSDVSYTKERTERILYPALAMGEESYYLYIDADNTEITPEDRSQIKTGDIISAGMVEYRAGVHPSLASVSEAADAAMYERKQRLKGFFLNEEPQENAVQPSA